MKALKILKTNGYAARHQSDKQKKEMKANLEWKGIKFKKKERKKKQSNYAFDGHSQHIITCIYDNTKQFCFVFFLVQILFSRLVRYFSVVETMK